MYEESELYLSADRAAAMLGVSLTTLYAYVSRKHIRSAKVPGSKKRLYWKADIENLCAGSSTSSAEPQGDSFLTTAITLMTESGPYYRGQSAIRLSESATLEDVAGLLWGTNSAFGDALPKVPDSVAGVLASLESSSGIERALAVLPLIEYANPRPLTPEGYVRGGADVLRCFASVVVGGAMPTTELIHVRVADALGVEPVIRDLIRRVMVLSADNELDPTTYAVRAAANTGLTPHYAAVVGLAASHGRRLAIGRGEVIARLVDEICQDPDPREPLLSRLRSGAPVPGFGSSVYGKVDPRAESLLDAMRTSLDGMPELSALLMAIDAAQEVSGIGPDFAVLASFVGRLAGLRGQEMAIAGIGRMAGWIAHAMEQYQAHELIRPHAAYVGKLP